MGQPDPSLSLKQYHSILVLAQRYSYNYTLLVILHDKFDSSDLHSSWSPGTVVSSNLATSQANQAQKEPP